MADPKIYIILRKSKVKKAYDMKLKSKFAAAMDKGLKAAVSKSKDATLKKPDGFKPDTHKGVSIGAVLTDLTKTEKGKNVLFKAQVQLELESTKKTMMPGTIPSGSATVQAGANDKNLDGEAIYAAQAAVEAIVTDKLIPHLKKA